MLNTGIDEFNENFICYLDHTDKKVKSGTSQANGSGGILESSGQVIIVS